MSDAQAHITDFWSTVAPGYEAHGGNVTAYGTAGYQCWEDALAATLPPPPAEILDVATGTGYVALAAAALGHHVTAIDLSPQMLEELAARAAHRGLSVDALLGDGVAFAQHYTPATTAELPLMHIDRPAPILAMLSAAGFVEVAAEPHPELALEGGVPYIFTAKRP
jgi:2-polyprenyl-3-methyl-5-hydroxy-6-metoxy-1,4-benzoquinol methylase